MKLFMSMITDQLITKKVTRQLLRKLRNVASIPACNSTTTTDLRPCDAAKCNAVLPN